MPVDFETALISRRANVAKEDGQECPSSRATDRPLIAPLTFVELRLQKSQRSCRCVVTEHPNQLLIELSQLRIEVQTTLLHSVEHEEALSRFDILTLTSFPLFASVPDFEQKRTKGTKGMS